MNAEPLNGEMSREGPLSTYSRAIREERSQARIRLIYALLFLCYAAFLALFVDDDRQQLLPLTLLVAALGLYAAGLLWWLRPGRAFSPWRQGFSILADVAAVTIGMALLGEWGVVAYPLLLWSVVANGMRFGLRYLAAAMVLAVVGWGLNLLIIPYWQQNLLMGGVLLVSVVGLPLFYVTLVKRLHRANEELEARLQQASYLASHDPLTGLANRLFFNERLEAEIKRAAREGGHFAVLFLDLDGFKPVNDIHGHAIGDELLRAFAERLRREVRDVDIVARMGGDEFAVIAIGWHPGESEVLMERLETALARPYRVDHLGLEIGVSIGSAFYPEHGRDSEALLQSSDESMYRQKEAHRGAALK